MCQLCDANEEHTIKDCEDAAVLLHGDPFAGAAVVSIMSARQIVEAGLDLT
jgi:hypothetical protein